MHSNKLKRKLADLGLESSLKLSESFCLIGTPLPPLEKAKDTGEFVPLWKQEVRDEKGRRRLHGAFTGGFSAGYYNTVGSAEGWTPSTFTSSRSERANRKQARPEDFMDEEDLAELKDGQKLVDTTEQSDLFSSSSAAAPDSVADALQKLIPLTRDSIGSRLLRKMGWKPGQGVGPKITHRQLKQQERVLRSISGWSIQLADADGAEEEMDDADEANKHMYPPRDTPLIQYQRKDNCFGVGYVPGTRLEAPSSAKTGQSGNGPRISAGFGLGTLNDAEEDDLDVYEHASDRAHQRHLAFDEAEATDDLDRSLTSTRQRQPRSTAKGEGETLGRTEMFSNGAPVLLGFALSKLSVEDDQWFEAPKPPSGWEPDPRRVWTITSNEETQEKTIPDGNNKSNNNQNRMTADERGAILGEVPLPSAPRSVFDYLAPKDRERLRNLATSAIATRAGPDSGEESVAATGGNFDPQAQAHPQSHSVPRLDSSIAKAALTGFQPFHADPAKAGRYVAYLKSQINDEEHPESMLPGAPGQSPDGFYHELREFAQSATIFKPAAGVLGGRFATAKVVERLDTGKEGLYLPASTSDYIDVAEKPAEPEKKKEDPKVGAARMGMFGSLTREVQQWDPAKLLCKRFGVKEPVREFAIEASVLANGENDWKAQMPSQPSTQLGAEGSMVANDHSEETLRAATASFRTRGNDLSNIGLGEDDDQGRDTLSYVKPERDIFKAIFESDDEEEEQVGEEEPMTIAPAALAPPSPVPLISPSSPSPPPMALDTPNRVTGHLGARPSTAATYVPSSLHTNPIASSVDMATFRPTFAPKNKSAESTQKSQSKKKSKDKNKNKKGMLSFEDGDELITPEKPKKKKRKDKDALLPRAVVQEEDEDEMWVEKPVAAFVQDAIGEAIPRVDAMDVVATPLPPSDSAVSSVGRRMRAVDFL